MKIQNINNNNNTDVNKQTTNDLPPVGALLPSENRWRREIQPFPSSPREKARRRRTFFMERDFPRIYFGWWYIIIAFFWSYLLCVPSHASPFFFSLYLSRCYWFLFLDVRRNDKQCLGSYPRVFSMLLIHFCTSRSISLVSCV